MDSLKKIIKIDNLLKELFRKKQWEEKLGLHSVFENWPQLVGEGIASRSRPHLIRGTVLWVNVSDSVWMQQLHLQKMELLDKINRNMPGKGEITDIRFLLNVDAGQQPEPDNHPAKQVELRPIDPDQLKSFQRLITSITDDEMKGRLLRLWTKNHQRSVPLEDNSK
ncbi:MAG: DUF721 domain-containing protein [Desulfobulbaceae bacterium]|nr:DUF721 domain-containing protein [Desulfobulbaceae bacterium]HIJ79944.1 DUF721 domain-containing protein [Deltaproteobacteria bacterium]